MRRTASFLTLLFTIYGLKSTGKSNPNEDIYRKIDRISNDLGVRIILHQDVCDSWNAVTYKEESEEQAISHYLDLLCCEFEKYPDGFLPLAGVHTLILVKDLKFNGQQRAAIPDPYRKQLFLSINGAYGIHSDRYLIHVMHHELHHCTEYAIWNSMSYDWNEWMLLNESGFCYGNGGAAAYVDYIKKGVDFYTPSNRQKGFINRYSLTGDEEDRAELMAFMMSDLERPVILRYCKQDEILRKKIDLLANLLNRFTQRLIFLPAMSPR